MRITADNPSPMTLEGTNTYLLFSTDDSRVLLIDPGPELPEHRDAFLAAIGDRELAAVVLTHQHADHSELLGSVDEWGPAVPVHAMLETFCRFTEPVVDGEQIRFGTADTDVVTIHASPGHTSDSISIGHGTMLYSGDTVLGRGTTIVTHPEGSIGDYLASLDRLRELVSAGTVTRIAPAHGPMVDEPAAVLDYYKTHRLERIDQVSSALAAGAQGPDAVRDVVYADVPENLKGAASQIVKAQLAYLGRL